MVYSLMYHRPAHVPTNGRASINGDEKQMSLPESDNSSSSQCSIGIPEALSFDRVMSGGVCPPCTLRDFLNYMRYIEHDAENLQFFLWYRGYVQRFEKLPGSDRALAPEWHPNAASRQMNAADSPTDKIDPAIAAAFKGTDFEGPPQNSFLETDPFSEHSVRSDSVRYDSSTSEGRPSYTTSDPARSQQTDHSNEKYALTANETFTSAGLKWTPFAPQPFRQEISRIISIYLAPSSPRQLNLSAKDRSDVLHALQSTTHPSALHAAVTSIEHTLRYQSHPNFIRWAICNGNRPRVIFARGLGIVTILLSLLASLLITLSSAPRAYRVIPLIGYIIGISTLFAAYKGMCVVLHGLHHRHIRPWEMFADEDDASVETRGVSEDSLLSVSSNSYETEPWVARYEKRNTVRKVFDRQVWIQEPALRSIQDTIFLQSMLGALVVGGIVTGIFCAVPAGKFF